MNRVMENNFEVINRFTNWLGLEDADCVHASGLGWEGWESTIADHEVFVITDNIQTSFEGRFTWEYIKSHQDAS